MNDREKLIALLKGNLPYHSNDVAYWQDEHIGALADHLIANGVVVREKGEWTEFLDIAYDGSCNGSTYKCPKCSEFYFDVDGFNFCPNCGADIRIEEQNRASEGENDG